MIHSPSGNCTVGIVYGMPDLFGGRLADADQMEKVNRSRFVARRLTVSLTIAELLDTRSTKFYRLDPCSSEQFELDSQYVVILAKELE